MEIVYQVDSTNLVPENKILKGDKVTIKMDGNPDITAEVIKAEKGYIKIDATKYK